MSRSAGRRGRSRAARAGVVLVALAALAPLAMTPAAALAHPLGNFSINHYTALRTEADTVAVRYVVDLAEIPTFQEMQDNGFVPDSGHPSVELYLSRRAEGLKEGLVLEADGRRLVLRVESSGIAFTPGAGGLPTMRIDIAYRARLLGAADTVRLTYHDGNDAGRAGWREIVASAGAGTGLAESTAPAAELSRGLTDYPAELLQRPPQDVSARIVFTREVSAGGGRSSAGAGWDASPAVGIGRTAAGGSAVVSASSAEPDPSPAPDASAPAPDLAGQAPRREPASPGPASRHDGIRSSVAPASRRPAGPRSALTELVTTSGVGLGIAASALAIAAGLGALHALEPGHGKTVVAAYLVGSRGTAWHAVILGLIVTASHTAGVYVLGAATLYASRYVVPDRLYPWLAAGSGAAIAALGALLFVRRLAGRRTGHDHGHEHGHGHDDAHGDARARAFGHGHPGGHGHDHGDHAPHGRGHEHGHRHEHSHVHRHGRGHHHHAFPVNVSLGQLLALGVSGGIVPCPAALVVLLSAISLRRVGFGLLLVAAFSAGLAAVLVAIGILMVRARRLMARFTAEGPIVQRWLPLASSAAVAVFGVAITLQALAAR